MSQHLSPMQMLLASLVANDIRFMRNVRPDVPNETLGKLAVQRMLQEGWSQDCNPTMNYKQLFEQALDEIVLLRAELQESRCQAK